MDRTENPKIHCLVLDKPPHDLVVGDVEWKLCRIFATLGKSKERISREKNAVRRYKPSIAFTITNPSDADNQTLNYNKGVIKDHLGFSVNSETMVDLISGVLTKGTQWVLTTSEYLKQISVMEDLTVDTFYDHELDVSRLEDSLPSLFKLHTFSNRTEVALASQPIKKPIQECPKQHNPKPKVKRQKKEKAAGKTEAHVGALVKSESDENENLLAAGDVRDAIKCEVKESPSDIEHETKANVKIEPYEEEQHDAKIPVIYGRIKEEPVDYDYNPNLQTYIANESIGDTESKFILASVELPNNQLFKNEPNADHETQSCPPLQSVVKVKQEPHEYCTPAMQSNHMEEKLEMATPESFRETKEEVAKFDRTSERKIDPLDHGDSTLVVTIQQDIAEADLDLKETTDFNPMSHEGTLPMMVTNEDAHETNYRAVDEHDSDEFSFEESCDESLTTSFRKVDESYPNSDQHVSKSDVIQKDRLHCECVVEKDLVTKGKYQNENKETKSDDRNTKGSTVDQGLCANKSKPKPINKSNKNSLNSKQMVDQKKNDTNKKRSSVEKVDKHSGEANKQCASSALKTPSVTNKKQMPKVTSKCTSSQDRKSADVQKQLSKGPGKKSGTATNGDNETKYAAKSKCVKLSSVADLPKASSKPQKSTSKTKCTLKIQKLDIGNVNRQSKVLGAKSGQTSSEVRTGDKLSKKKKTIESKTQTQLKENNSLKAKTASQLPPKKRQQNYVPEKPEILKKAKVSSTQNPPLPSDKHQNKPKSATRIGPKTGMAFEGAQKKSSAVGNKPALPRIPKLKQPKPVDDMKKSSQGLRKRVTFADCPTAPRFQSSPKHVESSVHPKNQQAGILDSLNTSDSFLFNPESDERSGVDKLLRSVIQNGRIEGTSSSAVVTSLSPVPSETVHDNVSRSNLKRCVDYTVNDSDNRYSKRKRIEAQEQSQLLAPMHETYKQKKVEKESAPPMLERSHRKREQCATSTQPSESSCVKKKKRKRGVTLLVGDSMLQHIQPDKFFKNKPVCVKAVPEARLSNISEYVGKFLQQEKPSDVILHIGTNDLHHGIAHIVAHIESLGKLIAQSLSSVQKFTISSIIQRNDGITDPKYIDEVNRELKNLHRWNGWSYIDNRNIAPEVHIGSDGIHLNTSGIRVFAANIGKHLGCVQADGQNQSSGSSAVPKEHQEMPRVDQDPFNTSTEGPQDMILCNGMDDEDVKPVFLPGRTLESATDMTAPHSQTYPETHPSSESDSIQERSVLIVGDAMLGSICPEKLSRRKPTTLIVMPDAKVDSIGKTVMMHAAEPQFSEVILHVGGNDLKDGVYTEHEIAAKIMAIGMNLPRTCPNIATFTISGIISTFHFNLARAKRTNRMLESMTLQYGWNFINNGNINSSMLIKKTQLGPVGVTHLAMNILEHLRSSNKKRRACRSDRRKTRNERPRTQTMRRGSRSVASHETNRLDDRRGPWMPHLEADREDPRHPHDIPYERRSRLGPDDEELYPGYEGCHECGGLNHKIRDCPIRLYRSIPSPPVSLLDI